MTITATDAFGPYTDTGVASAPSVRPNVEIDSHTLTGITETDSGRADKKLVVPTPQRPASSPR